MARTTCEIWVLVDANGDYVATDDPDALVEQYEERVGELAQADGFRKVKVTVSVPLPEVIEAAAEVAEDEPAEAVAA